MFVRKVDLAMLLVSVISTVHRFEANSRMIVWQGLINIDRLQGLLMF